MRFGRLFTQAVGLSALLLGAVISLGPGQASSLSLECENGRTYPIGVISVTEANELVTGTLYLGRRRGAYVRLVPMGLGYRYAGRGVWFDGFRDHAVLFFGQRRSIKCIVRSTGGVVLRVRA